MLHLKLTLKKTTAKDVNLVFAKDGTSVTINLTCGVVEVSIDLTENGQPWAVVLPERRTIKLDLAHRVITDEESTWDWEVQDCKALTCRVLCLTLHKDLCGLSGVGTLWWNQLRSEDDFTAPWVMEREKSEQYKNLMEQATKSFKEKVKAFSK